MLLNSLEIYRYFQALEFQMLQQIVCYTQTTNIETNKPIVYKREKNPLRDSNYLFCSLLFVMDASLRENLCSMQDYYIIFILMRNGFLWVCVSSIHLSVAVFPSLNINSIRFCVSFLNVSVVWYKITFLLPYPTIIVVVYFHQQQ